jgi:hypothetical protein
LTSRGAKIGESHDDLVVTQIIILVDLSLGSTGEGSSLKVIRAESDARGAGYVLGWNDNGGISSKSNFDKRDWGNTHKAAADGVISLKVAKSACEASQNAQKTSRL